MIVEILDILKGGHYYGAGKHVEIAKGKNQIIYDYKGFKRKLKRQYHDRKRD